MRALTLWQPWASQVFDRGDPKNVENRRTLMPPAELLAAPRPFFAVHAGKTYDDGPWLAATGQSTAGRLPFPKGTVVPMPEGLPYGVVLGVVRVRNALDARPGRTVSLALPEDHDDTTIDLYRRRWWLGPIGWRLFDAVPLRQPVPCRGALGVWTLPPKVERAVREQLDERILRVR